MKILTKKQINTRNESASSCSEHCMKQKSKVNIQKSKTRKFLWIAEKNTLGRININTVRNPPPSHALCYTGNIPHPPPPPHPAPAQTYQIKKFR